MTSHDAYQVEPWALHESWLDLQALARSESVLALANGHLGLRGNLDEGEPSSLNGTYLNGFYESHPITYAEPAFGLPEAGEAIVNVTDGKLIRLLVEDEPMDMHRGTLLDHERILDFRTGILERRLAWRSIGGHTVRVRSRRLVSFRFRSVAAICFEVEAPDEPLRLALQSNLLANESEVVSTADPRGSTALKSVLQGRLHVAHGTRAVLVHTTRNSALSVAAGMEHVVECEDDPEMLIESEPDLGRLTISVEVAPGRPVRLVKLLAYHWSSRQSVEWLRDQVDGSLEGALAEGFEGLARAQRDYLDDFWVRADIEIDGDDGLQQALRFALFQTLQATARAEQRAIAAKGLTGSGYDGHAFWDTESFVLPLLTYIAPRLTRDALIWRHSTLDLARERARQLGLPGAAFPWRTIQGAECSGYWPAGLAAVHITADIAGAVRRYVAATADDAFERDYGTALLVETARLWLGLGHVGPDGRFRIDGVTGPDEYSAVVDNNVYTNLTAQANLRGAVDAVGRHPDVARALHVGDGEVASWRKAAEAMFVPYDETTGLHPQDQDFLDHERWDFEATPPEKYPLLLHSPYFDIYRKQVTKQADLVFALIVCSRYFTKDQKRRDFDYYEGITVRDSSLSACIQAIAAAEVGHLDLAHRYLAEAAFMDLHDLEDNIGDGLHIASLAGAAWAVIAGLGGLRDDDGGVRFSPHLPDGITRVAFTIGFGGNVLTVEIVPDQVRYAAGLDGPAMSLVHEDEPLRLAPGARVTKAIAPVERSPEPAQPRHREPMARSRESVANNTRGTGCTTTG